MSGLAAPEEWRSVPGRQGEYDVSNLGRIRSLDRYVRCPLNGRRLFPGKVLKGHASKNGYPVVNISGRVLYIHRLIAEAFLPNWSPHLHVNHIDHNRANNRLDNLEMVTREGNMGHAARAGRLAQKLTADDVLAIRAMRDVGWKQATLAARFGVSQVCISHVGLRKIWAHVQ